MNVIVNILFYYAYRIRRGMNTLLRLGVSEISMNLSGLWENIKAAFINFSLVDAFDILFLAFTFFFIFRFFRGKKGGAVLIGISVCLVFWFVATTLELGGVSFIFSKVFEIGVLALIIIFQPEIRDVLERIGSGPFNGFFNFGDQKKKQQIYYSAVDNICAAVSDLSRTKTGALIVLERTTSLDDILSTGVTINADTSSFLLRNLFFNRAPLHDGAVVIGEGKVIAAGCLLPLTRRQDIDSDLGTRHRAAVGMSEVSDAIIIVVSEETGIISVASDCTLTRNYTPDSLRTLLLKSWVRDKSERVAGAFGEGKKRRLFRFYFAVISSIACAFIFWLYVKVAPYNVLANEAIAAIRLIS
ncbi:MAG: TIGR00159 family protein [Ruminococcaceae bacterium]|nr:TIGR00159 family protein [Oscillospiraceae bacterium]